MPRFDETYSDSAPRKNSKKKSDKKTDWLVTLSSVQLVLAVIGVVLVFALSRLSPLTFLHCVMNLTGLCKRI